MIHVTGFSNHIDNLVTILPLRCLKENHKSHSNEHALHLGSGEDPCFKIEG